MPEHEDHYEELWVPIEGFPNYEISNYGRVVNIKTEHELQITHTKYKRDQVNLYRNGKVHRFYVHRLVAQAFFQNYRDDIEVLHINQYAVHDNSVLNLTLGGPVNQGQKPIKTLTHSVEYVNVHIEGYGDISVALPDKTDNEALSDLVALTVQLTMNCVDPRADIQRFHPVLGYGEGDVQKEAHRR